MIRRRSVITREGFYYLFILTFVVIGSLLRHINLLVGLSAILSVAMIYNWRITKASLRHIRFARRGEPSVWCHQPAVFEVEVENPRPQLSVFSLMVSQGFRPRRLTATANKSSPLWKRLWQWLQGSTVKNYALLDALHVRETRIAQQNLEFRQRGEYEMGPLVLSNHFPLGLVRREVIDTQRLPLFVGPALGQLSYGWVDRMLGLGWQDARGGSTSRSGEEFFSLRPWVSGDSRRWIHWRATARHGSVLVRQFQRSQSNAFSLLIDFSVLPTPSSAGVDAAVKTREAAEAREKNLMLCEKILRIVATISESIRHATSDRAQLILVGSDVHTIRFPCSPEQWREWHQCLSTVAPSNDEFSFFRFLNSGSARELLSSHGNATLVVLSPRSFESTLSHFESWENQPDDSRQSEAHARASDRRRGPDLLINSEPLTQSDAKRSTVNTSAVNTIAAGQTALGQTALGQAGAGTITVAGSSGAAVTGGATAAVGPRAIGTQSVALDAIPGHDAASFRRQIRTWLNPDDSRISSWYIDSNSSGSGTPS